MVTIDDLYEKLERIENRLDALEPTIITIEKLQESGIIGMIDGFTEEFDNVFNYATKMEILDSITMAIKIVKSLSKVMEKGNLDRLISIVEKIDFGKITPLLEAAISCAPKAGEILKASSRRKEKIGFMELVNEVRSPEIASLISLAKEFSGCMQSSGGNAEK
ncbi:MAG: hypothetical protein QXN66_06740 [Thermoplasmatales archaeon]